MVLDRMPLDMMRLYGGGMGGGLWILMVLFWVGLIAAIVWLVIRLVPANGRSTGAVTQQPTSALPLAAGHGALESPVEILDRRFAQGEIDLETYQAHRAALVAARGGA